MSPRARRRCLAITAAVLVVNAIGYAINPSPGMFAVVLLISGFVCCAAVTVLYVLSERADRSVVYGKWKTIDAGPMMRGDACQISADGYCTNPRHGGECT
jgi:hypothetical protein